MDLRVKKVKGKLILENSTVRRICQMYMKRGSLCMHMYRKMKGLCTLSAAFRRNLGTLVSAGGLGWVGGGGAVSSPKQV